MYIFRFVWIKVYWLLCRRNIRIHAVMERGSKSPLILHLNCDNYMTFCFTEKSIFVFLIYFELVVWQLHYFNSSFLGLLNIDKKSLTLDCQINIANWWKFQRNIHNQVKNQTNLVKYCFLFRLNKSPMNKAYKKPTWLKWLFLLKKYQFWV